MILALYNRLKKVSLIEHGDIVLDAEIIKSQTGRARKLRLVLIDNTYVDVWYSEDRRYAYHWEQSGRWNFIYRHDNAPTNPGRQSPPFLSIAMKEPNRMSKTVISLMTPKRPYVNFLVRSDFS